MFENNRYTHSSGKQQIVVPNVKPGNMNAFRYGGTKRKRKIIKRENSHEEETDSSGNHPDSACGGGSREDASKCGA